MMSRHYVTMKTRPRDREMDHPAPVEPLYETERRAMTLETLKEWGVMTERDFPEETGDRASVRVTARKDQ